MNEAQATVWARGNVSYHFYLTNKMFRYFIDTSNRVDHHTVHIGTPPVPLHQHVNARLESGFYFILFLVLLIMIS
jgi:hypothetical protein